MPSLPAGGPHEPTDVDCRLIRRRPERLSARHHCGLRRRRRHRRGRRRQRRNGRVVSLVEVVEAVRSVDRLVTVFAERVEANVDTWMKERKKC